MIFWRRGICMLLGLLLFVNSSLGQPAEIKPKVDALFSEWDRPGSPGCVILVRQDGITLYERAYGVASLELSVPLSLSSVFLLASVSKQFVVFAIMLLAQGGQLSLDDDIRKHVPEVPDFGKKITLRHLIHHTSGLREDLTLFNLAGWRSGDIITRDDFLRLIKNQKDLSFDPGEQYLYCNAGYHLLAIVVERVAKKPFPVYAQENIFQPLGMKATVIRDHHRTIVPNLVEPYAIRSPKGFLINRVAHDPPGASNVHSTVGDLARWDQAFQDGSFHKTIFENMLVRGKLNSGKEITYAGGVVHDTYRGLKLVTHSGSHGGYKTVMVRFPEQKLSIIVLANLTEFVPLRIAYQLADLFLAEQVQPRPAPPKEAKVEPDVLKTYLGEYWLGPSFWNVSLEKDHLVVQVDDGKKKRLLASSDTEFFEPDQPQRYRFVKSKSEMVLKTFNVPQEWTGERVQTDKLSPEKLAEHVGTFLSPELGTFGSIELRDGSLVLQLPKNEVTLRPLSDGKFLGKPKGAFFSWFYLEFTRHEGNVIGYTLTTERVKKVRYDKVAIKK